MGAEDGERLEDGSGDGVDVGFGLKLKYVDVEVVGDEDGGIGGFRLRFRLRRRYENEYGDDCLAVSFCRIDSSSSSSSITTSFNPVSIESSSSSSLSASCSHWVAPFLLTVDAEVVLDE